MGEARRKALAARRGAGEGLADRMHVRWHDGAAATARPGGVLRSVSGHHWRVRPLGVERPVAVPQRQRVALAQRARHAAAGPAGWALALRPHRVAAREQARQRRRASPCAGAHRRSGKRSVVEPEPDALVAPIARSPLGAEHRREHRAVVLAPRGCPDRLQPEHASRPSHVCCTPPR